MNETLLEGLLNAKKKFPVVKKRGDGVHGSKYALMEDLQKATHPHLLAEGILPTISIQHKEGKQYISSRLTHIPTKEVLEETFLIEGYDKMSEHDIGSCCTYRGRILFKNQIGVIVEGEDDDGNAAQGVTVSNKPVASKGGKRSSFGPPKSGWAKICKLVNEDKGASFKELGELAQAWYGSSELKTLKEDEQQKLVDYYTKPQNQKPPVQEEQPPLPNEEDVPF